MAVKPGGRKLNIAEQIIEDPVSGLTIQFAVAPDGTSRLRLYGDALRFGNRELLFDREGAEAGGGTALTDFCQPSASDLS